MRGLGGRSGISAAQRHGGQFVRRADLAGLIPRPRGSARPSYPDDEIDLDKIWPELAEVAVWTSSEGEWQEHASFLLGTHSGHWHMVSFADPASEGLAPRLRSLPGFDADLLLELIRAHTSQIAVLGVSSAPVHR